MISQQFRPLAGWDKVGTSEMGLSQIFVSASPSARVAPIHHWRD